MTMLMTGRLAQNHAEGLALRDEILERLTPDHPYRIEILSRIARQQRWRRRPLP